MLGAVDWDNLVPAAAFVLGAVLATFATLRVVRALTGLFSDTAERHRRRDR